MTLVINFSTNTMHGFSEKKKKTNKQTNTMHAVSLKLLQYLLHVIL